MRITFRWNYVSFHYFLNVRRTRIILIYIILLGEAFLWHFKKISPKPGGLEFKFHILFSNGIEMLLFNMQNEDGKKKEENLK